MLIHEVSLTRLPKYDLKKDDINRHANIAWGKLMRPQYYTKHYRELRKAEIRRNNSVPQGRARPAVKWAACSCRGR